MFGLKYGEILSSDLIWYICRAFGFMNKELDIIYVDYTHYTERKIITIMSFFSIQP